MRSKRGTNRPPIIVLEKKNFSAPLIQKNFFTLIFRQNPSIYSLSEAELDITAGGLNDAIQLIEENLTDDLIGKEREEILDYKNTCNNLVELLAS